MSTEPWWWIFSLPENEGYVVVILDRTSNTFSLYEGPSQGTLLQPEVEIVGGANTHGGLELFLTRDHNTIALEVEGGRYSSHSWFEDRSLTRVIADFHQLIFNEDGTVVTVRRRS